jgi:magnesium chelatase family protein
MGLAKLYSRALNGIQAPQVVVEVHVANGLPSFSIVGLLDTEVKESRDRVRSAIQMSGFEFPARRITVNLAPADLPKESGRYDLPIAVGVLLASSLITTKLNTDKFEFAGELALDGSLRKINGALAIAYNARKSLRGFLLPEESALEASLVPGVIIYPAASLSRVIQHLTGEVQLVETIGLGLSDHGFVDNCLDFNQVKGQILVKDALEIAASGRHSVLLVGNPGCGKSMLAQRLITILPTLTADEAIETAAITSLSQGGFNLTSWGRVPFRQPHHSSSRAAIVGGGISPKPGEISLAHNGVLFLDEIPEFARNVLEVLREPLETRKINIARANHKVEFPADFQLIAAMNPCPCGNFGHQQKGCKCSPEQRLRYIAKLSAPLLDRIDLMVDMPHLSADELQTLPSGEASGSIRQRVIQARKVQLERQNKLNYELNNQEIEKYCELEKKAAELLSQICNKLGLSARAYYRLLKVARTIADLNNAELIDAAHIARSSMYKKSF